MLTRLLSLLLLTLAGCASQRPWASEIEPPGLVIGRNETVHVRSAFEPENERYALQIQSFVAGDLDARGIRNAAEDEADLDILLELTSVASGGAWGEEADCRLTVHIRRRGGGTTWRFHAVGYSGSTWVHDRIPNAISNAGTAVTQKLASLIENG